MQSAARVLSVVLFLSAAILALFVALISAAEEAYTSWAEPQALAWIVFSATCVMAAGLAAVPDGRLAARVAGVLLLVPAFVIQNEASPNIGSPNSAAEWRMSLAASLIVLVGGLLASGLAKRIMNRVPGS